MLIDGAGWLTSIAAQPISTPRRVIPLVTGPFTAQITTWIKVLFTARLTNLRPSRKFAAYCRLNRINNTI